MSLKIKIDTNPKKLKEQIWALEWQLKQDINEKDKQIFSDSLTKLKNTLNSIEKASDD